MIDGGNVAGKWSEKKMEDENGLRTVECLRGRLLAEREASRVAKEDADQMGKKIIELESQLRTEIKSRNRTEKRLKFLMKKLESLNISYVSDESDHSSSLEKSEISSVSSTASSCRKEPEVKEPNTQLTDPTKCEIGEPMKKTQSPIDSQNMKHKVSQSTTEKSSELQCTQNNDGSKTDDHCLKSSVEEKEINGENDEKWDDDCVDNSLALVPVDLPITLQTTDPPIHDASVQAVLDALRRAREKLQSSMERRRMVKVGSTLLCS